MSDDGLVFCVQRSSGFVHQQDGRLLDQGPGNRYALAFATGKACTVFAHHRLHPVWQSRNDFIKPGLLRSLQNLRIAGVRFANADVVGNAAAKQIAILKDLTDLPGQLRITNVTDIHASDQDLALRGIEETGDQSHHRGLAGTRCTYQRRHAARRHM